MRGVVYQVKYAEYKQMFKNDGNDISKSFVPEETFEI